MSNLTKQNLRKMIEQEGETAPRQWSKVELLQRVEEITGHDPTREKGKKAEEASEYRVLVRDLNHASRRKAELQQFCSERLGMQVNYNLTIPQLQKDAMAIIASRTPPEPSDLVGFGRHASLSYARLQSDHPEYCRWVKETAREGQCNPRLRRLAGWLLNDVGMVEMAQKEIRQPHKTSDMKGAISGGYPTLQEPHSPRSSTATSSKPQTATKKVSSEEDEVHIPATQLQALVSTIEMMKEEIANLKGERPRKKTTSEEPDVTSVMSFSMASTP